MRKSSRKVSKNKLSLKENKNRIPKMTVYKVKSISNCSLMNRRWSETKKIS
jgi:hypothetical protein